MSAERALIVEDERIARENLEHVLSREGYETRAAESGEEAVELLRREEFDLVLTDLKLPGMDGMAVMEQAKELRPEAETVVLTGYATVTSAVEAMRKGAYSYLAKPYKLDELRVVARRALEKAALRREVRELRRKAEEKDFPHLIGQSSVIQALKESIAQVAAVDCNALILGETGTGKELVSRSLHFLSPRKEKRFMAVNCASFNEELLTSELFGHEKGAFTGAGALKKGLMESADGGTFFLDEIGDMPLPMQAKLLRVLEEKSVMRIGGVREIPVDIRFVAATNKNLKCEVESGAFRQDLFYRLNVITLHVPSLSDRKEDIPLLCAYFLAKHAERLSRPARAVSEEALEHLCRHEYPGNVRELENIIERAVALCDGETVEVRHLPPDLRMGGLRIMHAPPREMITLEEHERRYVAWVLEQTAGNKTKAADILGIDRVSLWRKLKRYGLEAE